MNKKQRAASKAALHRIAAIAESLLDAVTLNLIEPQYGFRNMLATALKDAGYHAREVTMTPREKKALAQLQRDAMGRVVFRPR